MPKFKKETQLGSWRKLALVTWKRPSDPSVYGLYEFDATNALDYLVNLNQNHKSKVTLTHFVAKAIAKTIEAYPALNGIIKWGKIYKRDSIDIFVQVAIKNDENDLIEDLSGAKITNVHKKSLIEISQELQRKSSEIRHGYDPQFKKTFNLARFIPTFLLRPLLKLHGFLIYNLGIYIPSWGLYPDPFGSAMLTSVGSLGIPPGFAPLVPPSRCPFLICLGTVEDRPWVVDGKVVIRPIVQYTATFDHRFMDGLIASRMYKTFVDIVHNPKKHFG